jgi:hypothetical protein
VPAAGVRLLALSRCRNASPVPPCRQCEQSMVRKRSAGGKSGAEDCACAGSCVRKATATALLQEMLLPPRGQSHCNIMARFVCKAPKQQAQGSAGNNFYKMGVPLSKRYALSNANQTLPLEQ